MRTQPSEITGEEVSLAADQLNQARSSSDEHLVAEELVLALKAAETGFYSWDLKTNQVKVSAFTRQLFELENESVTDISVLTRHVLPEDLPVIVAAREAALRTGFLPLCEYRINIGKMRWIAERGRTQFDASGRPTSLVALVRSVDQQKQLESESAELHSRLGAAEQALDESDSRCLIAIEAAGLGFWDWNLESGVLFWSDEHYRIFGLDSRKKIESYAIFRTTVFPDDLEKVDSVFQTAIETGKPFSVDYRFLRQRDGMVRWIVTNGQRIRVPGQPARLVGIARDVTDRKEFEKRLRQHEIDLQKALDQAENAKARAEAAAAAKDKFLAMLSHELRTPLTPVLLTSSFLQERSDLPADVQTALGMIQRNVDLEARLIDDLLDLTLITQNRIELRLEEVDLNEVLRRALQICESERKAKKLRLYEDLTASRTTVRGDFARLQQVLWNLLKNAVKFTPPEGWISVRSRNVAGEIELSISDSGVGISPEAIGRIFEPFEQPDSQISGKFGGMGLGLAISKASVLAHKGTLVAYSGGRDCGATFSVRLPVTYAFVDHGV